LCAPALLAPVHPRAFQPLADQGLARGFDDPASDREVVVEKLLVAEKPFVAPVRELIDLRDDRRFLGSIQPISSVPKCPQHSLCTVFLFLQANSVLLELGTALG
jgi:hypothetical protein